MVSIGFLDASKMIHFYFTVKSNDRCIKSSVFLSLNQKQFAFALNDLYSSLRKQICFLGLNASLYPCIFSVTSTHSSQKLPRDTTYLYFAWLYFLIFISLHFHLRIKRYFHRILTKMILPKHYFYFNASICVPSFMVWFYGCHSPSFPLTLIHYCVLHSVHMIL